ncbi:hypothetical protein [Bilophila wadsworthia]|uniref:hypothetical protein n=1 Tax=Bilophila wadsworthia TaxID=35833 RepID=UPI00242E6742|nr:hypothetical protein [Bilophila wadsworthia]
MLEQEKPRRTIAERIRKKEPKPKKANTPKKRESYRVEVEPGNRGSCSARALCW